MLLLQILSLYIIYCVPKCTLYIYNIHPTITDSSSYSYNANSSTIYLLLCNVYISCRYIGQVEILTLCINHPNCITHVDKLSSTSLFALNTTHNLHIKLLMLKREKDCKLQLTNYFVCILFTFHISIIYILFDI